MKYAGLPAGMWMLFKGSFKTKLFEVLAYDDRTAAAITRRAHRRYRAIIAGLPEFEKGDRFAMNIASCAMLSAFILEMDERPSLEAMTRFYNEAMMTLPMKLFCLASGKRKFTEADYEAMRATAAFRAADRNPYSWNMDFLPYEDGSGYEARFTHCGICTLMRELGIFEYTPAMCRLDYTMSNAGGVSIFVRDCTIAEGEAYCDCGYLVPPR